MFTYVIYVSEPDSGIPDLTLMIFRKHNTLIAYYSLCTSGNDFATER